MRSCLLAATSCVLLLPLSSLAQQAGTPATAPASSSAAPAAQTSAPATEAQRQAEAARLVVSANSKLQRNEIDAAEKELNAAKDLNPNQQGLSGDLGAIALRRGNQTEALKLYRREVELHPDSDFAWQTMIAVQSRDDLKATETTARGWIAASPDKLVPRATLIRILWTGDQNAAALVAAKDAAAALPGEVRESNDFQLLLGEAELRGGDPAHGAERLSHLIQSDATPLQANDANYDLAKAHQQLGIAETSQRDVLKKLDAESLAWTGDESPIIMRNASVLFTAAWDTMGLILYQQGKFSEAESYLQAAWRNRPNAEIGEHLGDVQTALHKDREASRSYQLANFTLRGAPPEAAPALRKKAAAAAQKDHGELAGKNLADLLAAERTFPIAGATTLSGTAVYNILFTRDAVLRTVAAPGGTTPAQDSKVREAKLSALIPPAESAALFHTVSLVCQAGACSVRLDP